MSSGPQGVYADRRVITVTGVPFTVVRFRAATTRLNWHPGSEDPPNHATSLPGLTTAVNFKGDEAKGLVGAFNGGFKVQSKAGGIKVGDKVIAPMKVGFATLGIDASGNGKIFVWGPNAMPPNFTPVLLRQNLSLLVHNGVVTNLAHNPSPLVWGDTLHGYIPQPRTSVGINANGDVIYAASMTPSVPLQIATALSRAGALEGMQLDINPYWPIMGAAVKPIHFPSGYFGFSLPASQHSPRVFLTGWIRDFFAVSVR